MIFLICNTEVIMWLQFNPFRSINVAKRNKRLSFFISEFPRPWYSSSEASSWPCAFVLSIKNSPAAGASKKNQPNKWIQKLYTHATVDNNIMSHNNQN